MNIHTIKNELHRYKDVIFVVWGYKDTPEIEKYVKNKDIPYYRLEDGFIRSVDLGASKSKPLSICLDSQALYYDAQKPSDLEDILNTYDFQADPLLLERAKKLIQKLNDLSISKYNNVESKDVLEIYGEKRKKRILVVGQVEDDQSIKRGCSKPMTNNELVWIAKSENPNDEIIYKPHPDVLFNKRPRQSNPDDVKSIANVIETPLSLSDSFKTIDHVYTITSLSGFEALMRGIPVTTLGAPFYSGWGLTDDRQEVSRRQRTLSLEEVFAAAYILYPKYQHPFTRADIEAEEAVSLIKELRDINQSHSEEQYAVMWGLSKDQEKVLSTLYPEHTFVQMEEAERMIGIDITLFVRDKAQYRTQIHKAEKNGWNIQLINRGLFATVGNQHNTISSSLTTAQFNGHEAEANGLVSFLNDYDFEADDVTQKSHDLIHSYHSSGISGYNQTPGSDIDHLYDGSRRKTVLVLGNNEASPRYTGSFTETTNKDLIWYARINEPDAQLIFKPHPEDIQSGAATFTYRDMEHAAVLLKEPTQLKDWLSIVDEVYTIDSNGGLEAALYGKQVTVLGSPYYAGWGFTKDIALLDRKRTHTPIEVFAAAGLMHTTYYDPFSSQLIQPEEAVEMMKQVNRVEENRNYCKDPVTTHSTVDGGPLDPKKDPAPYLEIDGENNSRIGVLSQGMLDIPHLESFVNGEIIEKPKDNAENLSFIAGWGMKPSAKKAQDFSAKYHVPYLGMEDGFLRSVGLGVDGSPSLSVCVDDVGIYYDATRPSRLENILNARDWESPKLLDQADQAIQLIRKHYLSKYNHAPMVEPDMFKPTGRKRVLIVDQTLGDMSIELGLGSKELFKEMYEKAVQDNPHHDVYVKTHPDVITGKKQANIEQHDVQEDTVFIYDNCNPLSLLEKVDKVYVVTSQLGFEALLMNKEVHCFGMPFYAGWGLTHDRQYIERRTRRRTFTELFAAAYMLYPRYLNPYTNQRGSIFDVIQYLSENKVSKGEETKV
nr:hypothetical protein [Halobacillus halophilus]